jgi:hypothetical protein
MVPARRSLLVAFVVGGLGLGTIGCGSDDDPSSFCTFYRDYDASVEAAELAPGSLEETPDLEAIIADASGSVPDEIDEAWAVIADSQNDFADARARAGLDRGDPDQEAFESFDMSDELAAAEGAVSEWVDQNCEPVSDL